MRFVRQGLLILAAVIATASLAGAQVGGLSGTVTDAGNQAPLPATAVEIVRDDSVVAARATTDPRGKFQIANLAVGVYTVRAIRIGFRPATASVRVSTGTTADASMEMTQAPFVINPIIITASRREEKALDAPASVTVIGSEEVNERPSSTVVDHVRAIQGVDVASGGILQANVVARGFNNSFSGTLLTLTDNRFAFVPSLRINVPYLTPTTNEDIERIEVVLGPGAALYGPNAANGVMHVITKSPFDSRGTTVSVDAGERSLLRMAIRHAGVASSTLGYKFSLERFTADDWRSKDSVESALPVQRSFDLERTAGEARIDYRPAANSEIIAVYGHTLAGSALEPTGLGAAQVKDWAFNAYQLRARRDRLFAQVFMNQSDAGETFVLRNHLQPDSGRIVDRSTQFVAQVQHGRTIGAREDLIYGLDYLNTNPRTDGTINGRNEDDDQFTQIGGYVHSTTHLADQWDFVAAVRADHHSRLDGMIYSPRAALVFHPTENQNIRFTYNRAFDTPSTNNQFLDLRAGQLPAAGSPLYVVRALGTPKGGFTFKRDCTGGGGLPAGIGNLCMRIPTAFGGTGAYLPASAAMMYAAAVGAVLPKVTDPTQRALLQGTTGASFASARAAILTQLRVLNPSTFAFENRVATDVRDLTPIEPTITNAYELGYKGIIADRLNLSIDLWKQDRTNFVGPLTVETPNVFLDSLTLHTFLAAAFRAEGASGPQADALAAGFAPAMAGISGNAAVTGVPLGVVNLTESLNNPTDIVLAYRNFGDGVIKLWGSDIGAEFLVNTDWSVNATYSHVNKDLFEKAVIKGISDVVLNAPREKGSLAVRYRNETTGLSGEVRDRFVQSFPATSGVYIGRVPSYALLDAMVTLRPRMLLGGMVTVGATNLLNREHIEFAGGAAIGRLITTRIQYTF